MNEYKNHHDVLFLHNPFTFSKISFKSSQSSLVHSIIPKILWTFWHNENIPPFIRRCIDTWKETNPDYEVHIVKENNLVYYIGQEKAERISKWRYNDSPQHFADLVRLELLYQHGGIWIDASSVIYEPLDWLEQHGSFIIYSIFEKNATIPVLENSFMASTPQHPFLKDWIDEYLGIENYESVKHYIDQANPLTKEKLRTPEYHLTYIAARISYLKHRDEVKVLSAWDGPLEFWKLGGVKELCKVKREFAKFFKYYRIKIENDPTLEVCVFNPRKEENRFVYNINESTSSQ